MKDKNILAIDPGTNFGWALKRGKARTKITSGTKRLRDDNLGSRANDIRQFISSLDWDLRDEGYINVVIYEQSNRQPSMRADHVYGAIAGAIEAECEYHDIEVHTAHVKKVKKWATGSGNADKQMMVDAAKERGWKIKSHDEADALWILDYAINKLLK